MTAHTQPHDHSPTHQGRTRSSDARRDVAQVIKLIGNALSFAGHLSANLEALVRDLSRDSRAVAEESRQLYRLASQRAASLGLMVRSSPRMARLLGEAARLTATYRFESARAMQLEGEEHRRRMARVHAQSAQRLHDLAVELGGGVLKLGQLAACRRDLLPEAYTSRLSALTDAVPAEPLELVLKTVEDELGAPLDTLFSHFEPQALAAASLAQVHGATLMDGQEVAVKVQRSGIAKTIASDIAGMRVLVRALGDIVPQALVTTIVDELETTITKELNFLAEAANAAEMKALLAEQPGVVIPAVVESHCSPRVMTMERVHGQRFDDYLAGCDQEPEGQAKRDALFKHLLDAFFAQTLRHGVLHADPHPGNFLVRPDKDNATLALLDFGAVQRYSPTQRRQYAELLGATLTRRHERAAELLEALGFVAHDGQRSGLQELSELIMHSLGEGKGLDQLDPHALLQDVVTVARQRPLQSIPPHAVMLGRVLSMLGGLVLHHRPRIALFNLAMPHVAHALKPINAQ